jgi:hypothetical protein
MNDKTSRLMEMDVVGKDKMLRFNAKSFRKPIH